MLVHVLLPGPVSVEETGRVLRSLDGLGIVLSLLAAAEITLAASSVGLVSTGILGNAAASYTAGPGRMPSGFPPPGPSGSSCPTGTSPSGSRP